APCRLRWVAPGRRSCQARRPLRQGLWVCAGRSRSPARILRRETVPHAGSMAPPSGIAFPRGMPEDLADETGGVMGDIRLTLACGDYDLTRALIDGTVRPPGVELTVLPMPSPERHWRMMRFEEFDIAELSMSHYL